MYNAGLHATTVFADKRYRLLLTLFMYYSIDKYLIGSLKCISQHIFVVSLRRSLHTRLWSAKYSKVTTKKILFCEKVALDNLN